MFAFFYTSDPETRTCPTPIARNEVFDICWVVSIGKAERYQERYRVSDIALMETAAMARHTAFVDRASWARPDQQETAKGPGGWYLQSMDLQLGSLGRSELER